MEKLAEALSDSRNDAEEALSRYKKTPLLHMDAKELIKNFKSIANDKVLALLIAYNLKEKGDKSPFLSRTVSKLMAEPVLAAKFLIKYDLA